MTFTKSIRSISFISAVFTLCCSFAAAQTYYVRSGASGNGSGSDWNNAFDDLPNTLVRGATYWMADGTYSGRAFDEATSGTRTITIKKATTSENGNGAGWSSSYGDGYAEFVGGAAVLNFTTDYWIFDGQVGSGKSGHGFRVRSTSSGTAIKLVRIDNGADYIQVSHAELIGPGEDTEQNDDLIYAAASADGGASNLTFSYLYGHDACRTFGLLNYATRVTIDSCYFERRHSASGIHGEAFSFNYCGLNTGNVIRNSVFNDVDGTGIIVIKDSVQSGWDIYGNVFMVTGSTSRYTPSQGVVCNTAGDTTTSVRFFNNTIYQVPGDAGLLFTNGDQTNQAFNNIWYNCANAIQFRGATSSYNSCNVSISGSNIQVLSRTPFVNAAGGNFQLSAATAAGMAVPVSKDEARDSSGSARGDDGVLDRGAMEFSSGQVSTPDGSPSGLSLTPGS